MNYWTEQDATLNSEQFSNISYSEHETVGSAVEVTMRSNRNIIDSSTRQTLTMTEIEELKKEGTGAGKDLIEKLISSHIGIDEKNSFSLAKYKLLKTKKYLKRFTVLPVDVPLLTQWTMEEKDATKILEIREEMLALIGSWANVHFSSLASPLNTIATKSSKLVGRWLVVDETGGLLTASMAERMGILYPKYAPISSDTESQKADIYDETDDTFNEDKSNTITLIHNNTQPNLSLLKYFSFVPECQSVNANKSIAPHPLAKNLLMINWLQILSPHQDVTYSTSIPRLSPTEISSMKSSKRAMYYRKLHRWKRTQHVVTSTLRGGFDGLAVISHMNPVSILRPLLPLLRGGAQVCLYSPYIEPLLELADLFSTNRRTAFIQSQPTESAGLSPDPQYHEPLCQPNYVCLAPPEPLFEESKSTSTKVTYIKPSCDGSWCDPKDFPLNPTLLLNSSIQSARIRKWQVLPGRTHPVMTGKGGAEGFLFTAVRVLPAEGRVEARGKFSRKKLVIDKQNNIAGKKLKSEKSDFPKIS